MNKKVTFASKPLPKESNQWVNERVAGEGEETKRLTLDIPKSLHARIKSDCALNDKSMVGVIIAMLEEKFK
jgi:hypothetical protein